MEFSPHHAPLKVLGDEKRLRRVRVNLLEKAVKCSLEDGCTRVEAARVNGGREKGGKGRKHSGRSFCLWNPVILTI